MDPIFYEVVIAPGYDDDALTILQRKRNLRILTVEEGPAGTALDLRPISGGMLVQGADDIAENPSEWKTATEREPSASERADLGFRVEGGQAHQVERHCVCKGPDARGNGRGTAEPGGQRAPVAAHCGATRRRAFGAGIRRILPLR